jgi:hypothetical protein
MSVGEYMKIGKVIMGMALIVLGILLISMFWQVIGAKTASEVLEDDYDATNMNCESEILPAVNGWASYVDTNLSKDACMTA